MLAAVLGTSRRFATDSYRTAKGSFDQAVSAAAGEAQETNSFSRTLASMPPAAPIAMIRVRGVALAPLFFGGNVHVPTDYSHHHRPFPKGSTAAKFPTVKIPQ
jgi:hypothetical protein